jgi:Protein of unknown function (DUF3558)
VNRRGLTCAVAVFSTLVTAAGCSHAVTGSAHRAVEHDDAAARGYGYTDDRCGLLGDSSVQEIVGADNVFRTYSGAVCQYLLTRQSTTVDVTYSWFRTGSLDRERALAQSNSAQITDVEVERRQAFLARRSVTGNACSATAGTNPGVASWWVQIRGDAGLDVADGRLRAIEPCQLAQTLLSRTLSSDM